MRLRAKFFALYILIFMSVVMVVFVSLQTQRRLQRISDAMTLGNSLIEQSRLVRRITKDVMIASFAPETYANLKDILYFDSFSVALRGWASEAETFKEDFRAFMDDPTVRDLVTRGVLKDEHETAEIMSAKAFDRIDGLRRRVLGIQAAGLLGEDLYERIQQSSDPDLTALFDEARQTSYYLANSFESYLNYFIEVLRKEAAAVRADLIRSFIELGLASALIATAVTLVFSSRMVRRLRTLADALRGTAAGDFSTPLSFDTKDEFRDLARSFNDYAETLNTNLSAMVSLAQRMAGLAFAAEREADAAGGLDAVNRVLRSVTEAAVAGGEDRSCALVTGPAEAPTLLFGATSPAGAGGPWLSPADLALAAGLEPFGNEPATAEGGPARRLRSESGAELLAGSLAAGGRRFGTLVFGRASGGFNDLDLIRFGNYLEFAGILADNAATYAELAEERNAEYLALQSQIQPHFLYNVLGGFAALNRMGARDTLERSILALKELLRYAVDHDARATVGEELSFIARYCELQKMRFQERLEWSVTADEGVAGLMIPKLLLQPLVENAIIHGIEPTGEPGRLEIFARATEEGGVRSIAFTVRDDGAGFEPGGTEKGVGLRNVERRLALAYPAAASRQGALLSLRSAPGEGCEAILTLPEEDSCES